MFTVACFSFTKPTKTAYFDSYRKAMDAAANFNPSQYNHVVVYRETENGRLKEIATIYAN